MSNPTLQDICQDWRALDGDFVDDEAIQLIGHEAFSSEVNIILRVISAGFLVNLANKLSRNLGSLIYAFKLLWACKPSNVLVINGATRYWFYAGLLNRFCFLRFKTSFSKRAKASLVSQIVAMQKHLA